MNRSLLAFALAAAAAVDSVTPSAIAATPSIETLAGSAADRGAGPGEERDAFFGAGTWGVTDGGNTYLGQTSQPGQVKVKNNGIGRVAVHLISPWGFQTVIHLAPGAQLCKNLPQGWHVEVWDGGKDGLGANGTCFIP
jgi:hypothetical protein